MGLSVHPFKNDSDPSDCENIEQSKHFYSVSGYVNQCNHCAK